MTHAHPEPTIAVSVQLPPDLQRLLDEWISRRPQPRPDRSEAICALLGEALERYTSTIAEHPHTRVSGVVPGENDV